MNVFMAKSSKFLRGGGPRRVWVAVFLFHGMLAAMAQDGVIPPVQPPSPPPALPPVQEPGGSASQAYPQRSQAWTSDAFRNAFLEATKTDVTDALGPPDKFNDQVWTYRGLNIADSEDDVLKYSVVVIRFSKDEPSRVEKFRFLQ
jgi:hypothetical protein